MSQIEAIQATATDALSCKIYAIKRGYYRDDPMTTLITAEPERKSPEIARGTWARVMGTRTRLEGFLQATDGRKNIINCGCGFDTSFWTSLSITKDIKWIDIDMEGIVRKKIRLLRSPKSKPLLNQLVDVSFTPNELLSQSYSLITCDLGDVETIKSKIEKILSPEERKFPTCLIFECVLVYMDPIKSETMLSYFTSQFDKLMSISYEQVNLNDRFGQVMLNNLTSRGCGLAGYDACESVQTQQERFLNCGFQESKCELMSDIYESLPGRTDIEKLEFLDDVDIFKQLLQHYSITTSSNSAIFDAIVYNVQA